MIKDSTVPQKKEEEALPFTSPALWKRKHSAVVSSKDIMPLSLRYKRIWLFPSNCDWNTVNVLIVLMWEKEQEQSLVFLVIAVIVSREHIPHLFHSARLVRTQRTESSIVLGITWVRSGLQQKNHLQTSVLYLVLASLMTVIFFGNSLLDCHEVHGWLLPFTECLLNARHSPKPWMYVWFPCNNLWIGIVTAFILQLRKQM